MGERSDEKDVAASTSRPQCGDSPDAELAFTDNGEVPATIEEQK